MRLRLATLMAAASSSQQRAPTAKPMSAVSPMFQSSSRAKRNRAMISSHPNASGMSAFHPRSMSWS